MKDHFLKEFATCFAMIKPNGAKLVLTMIANSECWFINLVLVL